MVRVEDDFPIDPVDKLLNQAMEDEAAHVKDDFAASSEEYFGFLCDLANLAQDSFEKGLGLSVRAIHKTRVGLMKSIMPEMFDGPHPDIDILEGSQHVRYVEFKNGVYSTVNACKGCVLSDISPGKRHGKPDRKPLFFVALGHV